MLVSLNPKPVFYSLQPRANKQYNESGAVSKRPLPPHQNNPTAEDRGAKEQGENTKKKGKKGRGGKKIGGKNPKGYAKSNSNQDYI